jgi:hypothetical protein
MATERDILHALEGLPPAVLDQVKDFIAYLKERRAPRRPALEEKALAKKQLTAIKKWAGTNLGPGFAGRDHDAILYGKGQ